MNPILLNALLMLTVSSLGFTCIMCGLAWRDWRPAVFGALIVVGNALAVIGGAWNL